MAVSQTKKQIHAENLKNATRAARLSLYILIWLAILKAFGGYITNIIPLIGDAVGSFSDVIAMSAIFIGLKLSLEKANDKFKYGYHRIETFISLCISLLILYAGVRIFRESMERFFIPGETAAHTFGIVASAISIVVSYLTYIYHSRIAASIASQALLASADDKRNDAIISFGVMFSVIADKFSVPYVEGIIGLVISVIIIYTGVKYGKEALLYLLDYWDNPEITEKIRSILQKSKIVTAVKRIRLRHAGTYIFGEAFLEINPFTDAKDLRDELHRLEHKVEDTVEHLGDLVLYINPPKPIALKVALPVPVDRGLNSEISENPAAEFKFLFVEIQYGAIKKFYSPPDTFTFDKVSGIAEFLKKNHVNILISSLIRPLLYYNLRLNNIKVYPHFLDVKNVGNTVKLLLLDI